MKFISWNVNGLRACVQKGFKQFFEEADADFFCIQETKLQEGQIDIEFEGYEQYWNYADKKGYSGTAIFTKHTPKNVTRGMGIDVHDHEGRIITLEYDDFFLVTVYTCLLYTSAGSSGGGSSGVCLGVVLYGAQTDIQSFDFIFMHSDSMSVCAP